MAAQAREFWLPVLKKSNRKSRGILATTVRTCFAICFLLASTASAVVTISPADPELLQHGILDAYAAGQKTSRWTKSVGSFSTLQNGGGTEEQAEGASGRRSVSRLVDRAARR